MTYKTRMHSSRMRTARSLTISRHIPCTPPWINHAHPPSNHAPPEQPCMPPEQPHMPPWSNHACPPWSNHACPRATLHPPWEQPRMAPEQPHMPPWSNHACPPPPGATMHASPQEQPCISPPVDRMWTQASENITLPQLHCRR